MILWVKSMKKYDNGFIDTYLILLQLPNYTPYYFSKMVIGKRKYISSIEPSISKLWKGESHYSRNFEWRKEILFCAERWHFLTPQLSASLSSNWEVQLNCCSNARWCKNFEATILNTVMHSVLRKAWKCLNFSEKCWKCRNYFKDTNFHLSLGDPTKRVLNSGIMSEIGCVAALLPFDLKNLGLFSYWHLARASLGPKTLLKHERRG